MTDNQILDMAEKYGDWDDFDRWTFRDTDRLIAFALAIKGCRLKKREEKPAAYAELKEDGSIDFVDGLYPTSFLLKDPVPLYREKNT